MRYFRPKLAAGWLDEGAPTSPDDHFGGWPWGFPNERWPACRECGRQQTFLAQFRHDGLRLDLGADGRVLFLFCCCQEPYACEIWEPDGGAQTAIVLDGEDCTTSVTTADAPIQPLVRILSWSEHDDGVSEVECAGLSSGEVSPFDNDAWKIDLGPRLGGAPYWPPNASQPEMDGSWRLAAQLFETLWLDPPVPTADELGCTVLFQHTPPLGGPPQFKSHEPMRRKNFAPQSVTVVDDGTWAVNSGCVGAALLVFISTACGAAKGPDLHRLLSGRHAICIRHAAMLRRGVVRLLLNIHPSSLQSCVACIHALTSATTSPCLARKVSAFVKVTTPRSRGAQSISPVES